MIESDYIHTNVEIHILYVRHNADPPLNTYAAKVYHTYVAKTNTYSK